MPRSLFPDETPVAYARVAVERGIDQYPHGLTYGVPPTLPDLKPGQRVRVPLGRGNKPTAGTVIDLADTVDLPPDQIKLVLERDDSATALPAQLMDLARFISRYYAAPIGMTLAGMLPAAVKKNVGAVSRVFIDLAPDLDEQDTLPAKQAALLKHLQSLPDDQRPVEQHALMQAADVRTTGPVHKLIERGVVITTRRTSIEAQWAQQAVDTRIPDRLNDAQSSALTHIGNTFNDGFGVHLLFGVTGSGKTEVYIRLMQRILEQGNTALMLVPEIALTPQTGGRLIGRFPGKRVAVLHSGLTAAQRHQQWALAASGKADIVLGARSAVFAPIPDHALGLIVVDEEHDGSYKQDQVPRYHGRDVAIRRAQLADCPIVLGSATPSLETWHNATRRRTYHLHRLPTRAPGLSLPTVKVVDFADERRKQADRRVHLIGPTLLNALEQALDEGMQAIILLNRRGYASYIACPDQRCGWVMTCDHCDVTTVFHKHRINESDGFVRCHHCQAENRLPAHCPTCNRKISVFGLGTQRVEEELANLFPEHLRIDETMLRVDSDTMHGSRAFHDALTRFADGRLRVLLGTQMIAKGLDFPGVRVVGVINADTAINLPDFRAAERTFQLVNQVTGRCGRGSSPGIAIVQSFNPDVPAIQLAANHQYEQFAELELKQRAACDLPPITRMVRIIVRDEDLAQCISLARHTAGALKDMAAGSPIRVRGPMPCPIARLAGRHRQQIEMIGPDAGSLQHLLAAARSRNIIASGQAMAIDVDPIALL
jgi:primosomal protein N' (replication factor Y)